MPRYKYKQIDYEEDILNNDRDSLVEKLKNENVYDDDDNVIDDYLLLNYAIMHNSEIAEFLASQTDYKYDVEGVIEDEDTPILLATLYDNFNVVKTLIERGANINETYEEGRTLLHAATLHYGFLTRFFLNKGINRQTYENKIKENFNILSLLISKKTININKKDDNGMTALHYASINSYTVAVKLLLENNADPTIKNNKNKTALDLAILSEIRKLLKEPDNPSNVSEESENQQTNISSSNKRRFTPTEENATNQNTIISSSSSSSSSNSSSTQEQPQKKTKKDDEDPSNVEGGRKHGKKHTKRKSRKHRNGSLKVLRHKTRRMF